jgi:hypothetical protein
MERKREFRGRVRENGGERERERERVNWLGDDAAVSGVGAALTIPTNATATRGRKPKNLYMCFQPF